VTPAWLEQQTGVAYATLRKHYGAVMPSVVGSQLDRFAAVAPHLFRGRPDGETVTQNRPLGNTGGKTSMKSH
jgi:hypothetical protein